MQPPPPEGADWWYRDDGRCAQCAPYPTEILNLGGYRWLGMDGRLLTVPADMADFLAD